MARFQHSFLILLHEATHSRLASSRFWNDFVGQFFCGAALFTSLKAYRTTHFIHHRDPLAPTDPDLALTGGYPRGWRSFRRKLLRDFFGLTQYKTIRLLNFPLPPDPKFRFLDFPWTVAIGLNAILFFLACLVGNPWHYLWMWILPQFSFLALLMRIRGVTEHAGYSANPDQAKNSRTVTPSWQTWLVAPHAVAFHGAHHLYPSIPFYHLKQAHELLWARNRLYPECVTNSYFDVMNKLVIRK